MAYRGYSVDATLRGLSRSILPEIRGEWVQMVDNEAGASPAGGKSFLWVEADILKLSRIDVTAGFANRGAAFTPQRTSVLAPFFVTASDLLFRRPVAVGAVDGGNVLADNVTEVKVNLRLFGGQPLSFRWFDGDNLAGLGFGSTWTISYPGLKIGDKIGLDLLYGNKSRGAGAEIQYLGIAASTAF
ncbi:MAG: hypothetical protein RMK62_01030 [Armatimonadota bacterium]|nr:hypothetical protein [Armatimonadota bacterium]